MLVIDFGASILFDAEDPQCQPLADWKHRVNHVTVRPWCIYPRTLPLTVLA